MGILIVGAVVGIVGVILWIVKGKKEGKAAHLDLTETSKVSEVNENYTSIQSSMGDGSFTHFCEVKGVAHTDSPLESELAKEQVVYYSAKVEHQYEKLEKKKNSEGKMEKKWVKKKDIVSDNTRWADNWGVKDDSGFIKIDPAKAELHTEQIFSQFEKSDSKDNNALNIKIGGFSLGIGDKNPGIKSIGYKYTEEAIKLNTDLYVLADANDRDGTLNLSKPKDKKLPFIVSTKSEDELIGDLGSSIKGLTIGAYVCWGLGGVGIIVGALKAAGLF